MPQSFAKKKQNLLSPNLRDLTSIYDEYVSFGHFFFENFFMRCVASMKFNKAFMCGTNITYRYLQNKIKTWHARKQLPHILYKGIAVQLRTGLLVKGKINSSIMRIDGKGRLMQMQKSCIIRVKVDLPFIVGCSCLLKQCSVN